jgi:uncharacterized protein (TIGR02453 family)
MGFKGFPPEALDFWAGLEADNSKSYWNAHKDIYDRSVRGPLEALTEACAEFGDFKIFRPYRDVRFSRDKSPYKTHMGAVTEGEGGALYYVQLSATGLFAAAGYYVMASDQLERYRAAVVEDSSGEEIEVLVASLEKLGYDVSAHDTLKTAPRGFSKDHPRAPLLRRKGLIAGRAFEPARWLHTRTARDRVVKVWTDAGPLCNWLDDHVGPSHEPPPERR